jgi:hypothetical protein
MEQRRLRLGDILDDYCPRERRVTNHAVVAMIEEDVKQTRCTTCDAEHAYKGARVPKRRRKETPSALYKEVLAGMPEAEAVPVLTAPVADAPPASPAPAPPSDAQPEELEPAMHAGEGDRSAGAGVEEPPAFDADAPAPEDGPVHRRLIRATLPRPEGQKDTRQLPEFTIRQNGGRGNGHGHFRGDRVKVRGSESRMRGNGLTANGNRAHGGAGSRFARGGQGRGGAQGGFRGGQQRHGGKKGRG